MFEGLFQPVHLFIILVIAVIVLGPGRITELGTGLGKGIKAFRKSISPENDSIIDITPEPDSSNKSGKRT